MGTYTSPSGGPARRSLGEGGSAYAQGLLCKYVKSGRDSGGRREIAPEAQFMPGERLELSQGCPYWILSPARLPVPPLRHRKPPVKNGPKKLQELSSRRKRMAEKSNSGNDVCGSNAVAGEF